jgi:hypothetical protein
MLNYGMRKLSTTLTVLFSALLLLTSAGLAQAPATKAGLGPYIKYSPTSKPGRLDTSIVTYRNARGQEVDLISAVHVGSSSYYKTLNERFKTYDAVLYELILPDEMAGQRLPAQMSSGSGVSGMQGMLARSLGLVTQIDKIDYSAKNFVHADLTQSGLSQKMAERQENVMGYLMKAMMNSGSLDEGQLGVTEAELAQVDFTAVLSGNATPKDRKVLRKLFASALASSGGLLSALGDTALIAERNKTALGVLERQTAKGNRRLAIFYGAAHMPDLSKRLKASGWNQSKTDWIQAWTL